MFDAFEISQLLKLSVNIESIAAYDEYLLVGTKVGHLLMYEISHRYSDNKYEVQLRRYNKFFSKKPIQQLSVVPEHQLLISLSDNVVALHDTNAINFPFIGTVPDTKGASLFSLDVQRTPKQSGGTSVIVRLCVVVKRKLHLFYWKNGEFFKLMDEVLLPDTPKAIAWIKEIICIGLKGYGEYMLYNLNKTGDAALSRLCPPGNSQPTVQAMNETAFIVGKDNHSLFISPDGDPASFKPMKWEKIPRDLVYDEPYIVALFPEGLEIRTIEPSLVVQILKLEDPRLVVRCRSGFLFIASNTHVWLVTNVTWNRQIHFLLEQKQYQLALKIANIADDASEDKQKNIHQIQTLYAYDLFNKKQFKDSMEQFFKLETDPYEVIQLFPTLLPQQAWNKNQPNNVTDLDDADLESGLLALIQYLREIRLSKKSAKQKKDKEHLERVEKMREDQSLTEKEEAEEKRYDQYCNATEQLFQIIDTTLLKCYLQTNDTYVESLLRLNHCHLGEAEKLLKKYEKNSELAVLYETKGLHKKALELLQKHASQPNPSLKGHERTVSYLQRLGKEHTDLICQFANWVLEVHPDDGLSIFIEDTPEAKSLPRPKILDFLLRSHEKVVIPYLDHVIHVWKEENPTFHNALVKLYREQAQMLHDQGKTDEEQVVRAKLLSFVKNSNFYTPETALLGFPSNCMFEERAVALGKLGRHEQALSIYVMILGDVKRAVQYCNEVYASGKEGSDEVYVLLMKMLISPPDSWLVGVKVSPATSQPDLETALNLLEEHAIKIQPLQALEVLPDKVPLCRIRHFLETGLQQQLSERRRVLVLKGLVYAENLQVQELRMRYESQNIKMTELNVCTVCKKRFGNQSAFARYPNGDIVHYSCQDRTEQT